MVQRLRRRLVPLTVCLLLLAVGTALAHSSGPETTPTPGPGGMTAQMGEAQGTLVFTNDSSGTVMVQDQNVIAQCARAFADGMWSFKETSSQSGTSTGQATLSRNGQPLLPTPALYFSGKATDGSYQWYDIYYSSKTLILTAYLVQDLQNADKSAGQIQYTVYGSDGTPMTTRVSYPLQFAAPMMNGGNGSYPFPGGGPMMGPMTGSQ